MGTLIAIVSYTIVVIPLSRLAPFFSSPPRLVITHASRLCVSSLVSFSPIAPAAITFLPL